MVIRALSTEENLYDSFLVSTLTFMSEFNNCGMECISYYANIDKVAKLPMSVKGS